MTDDRIVMEFTGGVSAAALDALAAPTPREEVRQRQGNKQHGGECQKQYGACQLPHRVLDYVDARYVMDTLDRVVGRENWSRKHLIGTDGKVAAGIGILVQGVGWIEKWDGAGETDIEGEKGSFSDAFKRAAVSWGIARDLYPKASGQPSVPLADDLNDLTVPGDPAPAPRPTPVSQASGPSCPDHGTGSLKPSKFGEGQFYCSGKGGSHPNPKGYCTWSTNPRAA